MRTVLACDRQGIREWIDSHRARIADGRFEYEAQRRPVVPVQFKLWKATEPLGLRCAMRLRKRWKVIGPWPSYAPAMSPEAAARAAGIASSNRGAASARPNTCIRSDDGSTP
jgi:hypothetical protein